MAVTAFHPNALILSAAILLDIAFGDPVYSAHPIRLLGCSLSWFEKMLRKIGASAYGGGILLFLLLSVVWVGGTTVLLVILARWKYAAWGFHLFLAYSCLALHDLLRHAWAVESAARRGDLEGARAAISRLVGRDTEKMDIAACRRAAIESISENLTDGFVSPLAWYVGLGLPGLVLFKVVSTMDSMVGYKTPLYLHFGWCGARMDDVMNFLPARLTWFILAATCLLLPKTSARKAFQIGFRQHATLPGPNSGWSEAATAGALERRLIGPIWSNGVLVTEVWIGDPADPPAGDDCDVKRASILVATAGFVVSCIAVALCALRV